MCFALAMFGVMGIAMAANLFTLFVFYEVLTFATYPLVAHKGDEAIAQGRARSISPILVGASLTLLLPAIIARAGDRRLDRLRRRRPAGGQGRRHGWRACCWRMLVFGAAKAALIPVHGWLPAAMVAPTPVSALLHAVAVVKAGVFTHPQGVGLHLRAGR